MSLRIISGETELDLYKDTEINLTYSIEDILNLDVRRSSFSKDFTVPGTPKNREFFQNIQESNIDVRKSFLIATPVTVFMYDKVVIIGSIRLIRSLGMGNDIRFQVQITGRVRDLFSELEKLEVSDLDFTRFNHVRDRDTIIASWNNREGYVYPYIINGRSNEIFDEAYIWDFFPALFVKDFVDEIFNRTGFKYESKFLESDYFKSLIFNWKRDTIQDTDINERICDVGVDPVPIQVYDGTSVVTNTTDWVPLTPIRDRSTSWWLNSNLANRIRLTDTTTLDFSDELDAWHVLNVGFVPPPVGSFPAGEFRCKANGLYDINFTGFVFPQYYHKFGASITYTDSKLGFEYRYRLVIVRNNGQVVPLDGTTQTLFFNQGSKTLQSEEIDMDPDVPNIQPWRLSAQNVFLEEGDKIQVRYQFRFPSLSFAGNNNDIQCRLVMKRDFGGEFSRLFIRPSENQTFGNELVNMNNFFEPATNIKNLFLDLVKMFNLIIAPDKFNPNAVIIEPREDYWLSRQRIKHWEFDLMTPYSFTPMSEVNFNRYSFKYLEDGEWLNNSYRIETGKDWGQRELKIENDYSEIQAETKLTTISQTPLTNLFTNDRVAPYFIDKEDDEIRPRNVNLKILFYTGVKQCEEWYLKSTINDSGQNLSNYPYCGHFDDPKNPLFDLNFAPTDKVYHALETTTKNNLFNKFWRSTFNQLIDKNNKLLEANFYLTSEDIADLDYRDIILIDGGYWRINKIENWAPNKLTKVQLYKINLTKTYDVETISIPVSNRACPADVRITRAWPHIDNSPNIFVSDNGEITEDCCSTLGGRFERGLCFLYEDTGVIIKDPVTPVTVTRPVREISNGTTINTIGTVAIGTGVYVAPRIGPGTFITGNNSSIVSRVKDSFAFGDNISVDKPKTFYINDVAIDSDGDIVNIKPYIINGGFNTTLPPSRTNLIEVIHGGFNEVRNAGGDSKKRVIISTLSRDTE